MEIQGKIIAALDPKTGTNSRGDWKLQEFVLETHGEYPHKMMFSVFGEDRLQRFNIQVGQEVNVSFDIDAHEYNGRWFNSIRAFDVRPLTATAAASPDAPYGPQPAVDAPAAPSTPSATPFSPPTDGENVDDLPF